MSAAVIAPGSARVSSVYVRSSPATTGVDIRQGKSSARFCTSARSIFSAAWPVRLRRPATDARARTSTACRMSRSSRPDVRTRWSIGKSDVL